MKRILLTFFLVLGFTAVYSQAVSSSSLPDRAALRLYPNPATSFFSIEGISPSKIQAVHLYNLIGKRMKTFDRIEDYFYVSELTNGLYLVQIIGKDGKVLATRRLNKR